MQPAIKPPNTEFASDDNGQSCWKTSAALYEDLTPPFLVKCCSCSLPLYEMVKESRLAMDALTHDTPDSARVEYCISCHCNKIQFKVRMRPLEKQKVIKDNCSICVKNGYLFAYALRPDLHWVQGYESLKEYRFHTKEKIHKFCGDCGSSVLLDLQNTIPKDLVGLNVRMIQNIDVEHLDILYTSGRSQW